VRSGFLTPQEAYAFMVTSGEPAFIDGHRLMPVRWCWNARGILTRQRWLGVPETFPQFRKPRTRFAKNVALWRVHRMRVLAAG
jgi:hypothetical protein